MKPRLRRWTIRSFFSLLLLAFAVTLYFLVASHAVQWDATQSAINSLERSSVEVLQKMQGQVDITVFTQEQDAKQGDMRKLIRDFIAIYQRYKSDITLTFVDPVKEPDVAQKADVQSKDEMVVRFGGRSEHLNLLNEQSLSSALLRLVHSRDALVMYLDNHGERKLEGEANHDLGDFGKKLQQNGYRLRSLDLTLAQDVPDNASLLVLTHPQVALLRGEAKKLLRFIDNGGDVLWLLDAEPLRGLDQLAEKLGLLLPPGMVIDPAAQDMNVPFNWTLGGGYPPHAVTNNFNLISVFPFARSLVLDDIENTEKGWHRNVIAEGATRGWVTRNVASPTIKPSFDKNRDVHGPVNLAIAFEREVNDKTQRIIVVGSGSFLANAYLGNGGNADLGINMVNWLIGDEALITVQPRANKDGMIVLSKNKITAITLSFLILLPLIFLTMGGILWWRRKT
jgi:ABC-type uncharacterized transport system involved in gliding motility auxiliary subunit